MTGTVRGPVRKRGGGNGAIWFVIIVLILGAVGAGVWKWRDLQENAGKQARASALLDSAETLVESNRDDEAEAKVREALGLVPGEARGFALKTRIEARREIARQRNEEAAAKALEAAEKRASKDLQAAIKDLEEIGRNASFPPEVKQKAAERAGLAHDGDLATLVASALATLT